MLESVRCPSCSSRYGLRLQRVKSGLRRARCFRCQSIFDIESEVQRLLATEAAPVEPEVAFLAEDLPDIQPLAPFEKAAVLESDEDPQAEFSDLILPAEPEEEFELETVMDFEEVPLLTLSGVADSEAAPPFEAPLSESADSTPSLTLGDLDGVEEELLEKTLVAKPVQDASLAQEVRATLPDSGGTYASAKDAISRLLGETPRVEAPVERRPTHAGNSMDVEAALDALDSTLGGTTLPKEQATKPIPQPSQFRIPIPEPPVAKPMNSTIKLSHEELMAAMVSATKPSSAPPPPKPLAVPAMPPHSPQMTAPMAAVIDQNLYKVQLPKETQNNVSLEVLTTWIEQGRVQEFHMVARQQSDHWIEAGKVPALRMVFDRLKRAQAPAVQQAQATLIAPPEVAPPKKGMFGGLFGRG